jgi:hypothetical protein
MHPQILHANVLLLLSLCSGGLQESQILVYTSHFCIPRLYRTIDYNVGYRASCIYVESGYKYDVEVPWLAVLLKYRTFKVIQHLDSIM